MNAYTQRGPPYNVYHSAANAEDGSARPKTQWEVRTAGTEGHAHNREKAAGAGASRDRLGWGAQRALHAPSVGEMAVCMSHVFTTIKKHHSTRQPGTQQQNHRMPTLTLQVRFQADWGDGKAPVPWPSLALALLPPQSPAAALESCPHHRILRLLIWLCQPICISGTAEGTECGPPGRQRSRPSTRPKFVPAFSVKAKTRQPCPRWHTGLP